MYRAVDDYVPVSANWSDLEDALAALDVETIKDDLSGLCHPTLQMTGADSGHHDFQFEVDRAVRQLSMELRSVFA